MRRSFSVACFSISKASTEKSLLHQHFKGLFSSSAENFAYILTTVIFAKIFDSIFIIPSKNLSALSKLKIEGEVLSGTRSSSYTETNPQNEGNFCYTFIVRTPCQWVRTFNLHVFSCNKKCSRAAICSVKT